MELNDLFEELGMDPPATDPVPAGSEPAPETPPVESEPKPGETEGDPAPTDPEPTEPEPEPAPGPAPTPANRAFAELRVKTQKYEKILKSLGNLLGAQDPNDPDAILNLVQEKVLQAQAKQQNIPVELLQKLDLLEAESQERQRAALTQQALIGFQNVKNQFGLDDKGLDAFADELAQNGINPFAQQIDLVKVYRDFHFEDIIAKEVQKAVEAERQRALKAATESTTPGSTTGVGGGTTPSQIKTAAELENWFKEHIK
jgi:hypothetical protein